MSRSYSQEKFIEVFWNRISPEPNSGCWIWTGATIPQGYGCLRRFKKTLKAHRVSFELFKGKISSGLHVCHRCDNPSCVNPEHLFLGTNVDNMNDKKAKGRHYNTLKTHCKRGHLLSADNLVSGVGRICKTCHREKGRRWRALHPSPARVANG